jgi:hypothetical protein
MNQQGEANHEKARGKTPAHAAFKAPPEYFTDYRKGGVGE